MVSVSVFLNGILRVAVQVCAMACLLVGSGVSAWGQAPARPDRGIRPVGTYSVSDIESISLANGNVSVSIPLAGLPPTSGGELSWTLRAIYNSKTWDVVREEFRIPPEGPTYVVDGLQESDAGNWRIGGAYGIAFRESRADFDWQQPLPADPDYALLLAQANWYKVMLSTPDGAEHELRPLGLSSFSGVRDYLRGYYATTTPDFWQSSMIYYSFDGSFLWVKINPSSSQVRWEIYLPDGTKVVQWQDGRQRITDTNGNKIQIQTTEDSPGVVTTHCTDLETGREVQFVVSASSTQARYQTAGGDWVNIDLAYGFTTVKGKTYTVTDDNGQGGTCERTTVMPDTTLYVLRSITLPVTEPGQPGKQYVFSYNSDTTESVSLPYQSFCGQPPQTVSVASRGMGSLSQIGMPMGGTVKYAYNLDSTHGLLAADTATKETITTKTVVHDGVPDDVWNYGISDIGGSVANPDGTGVGETKYPHSPGLPGYLGGINGKAGLVYRSVTADKIIERQWNSNGLKFNGGDTSSAGGKVTFNPIVDVEYTTLLDSSGQPAKMAAREFQYDFNGNLTQQTDYDWFSPSSVTRDAEGVPTGVPQGATVLRVATNSYYNPATDASSGNVYAKRSSTTPPAPLILNALRTTVAGASQAEFYYDDSQDIDTPPSEGNLTKERHWEGTKWVETTHGYDSFGNRTSTTDPNDNTTTIVYDPATHAQPTSVTVDPDPNPQVTGDELITQTAYDYSTGLILSVTDPNNKQTTTTYGNHLLGTVDPFGRPGTVIDPLGRQTKSRYHDNARRVEVWSDLNSPGDAKLRTQTTVDMLGRPTKTESSEDGITYSISSDTVYHVAARTTFTSNPHRSGSEPTDGWTRTTRDVAGRVVEVASFSGAALPGDTGTSGSTGVVMTTYNANATTVTDQAGKVRRSLVDGLGRLVRLDEPTTQGLGSVDTPNQPTSYTYDPLGNLTQVVQAGQTRTFIYDALSRLRTATNPESSTINYTYYDNSNLFTKTDARNVVTTYGYDGLNRVKTRTYSGPPPVGDTPDVTYTYDAATVTNSKGRLTKVATSGNFVSVCDYLEYDALGQIKQSRQTTEGQPYTFSYSYNLAGQMTTETYPSGRVIETKYDSAGRISGVMNQVNQSYFAGGGSPADGIHYTAHGAIESILLGNGRREQTQFNSRLQPTHITLDSNNGSNLFALTYGYGTTNNNGNVLSQTIVAGSGGPEALIIPQTYTYDWLNRIQQAKENNGTNWSEDFSYDRFGNMWVSNSSGISLSPLTPTSSGAFDPATNRLTGSPDPYDPAGNQILDGPSRSFTYDAENRQVTFNGSVGRYFYDGDGHRVKTIDASGTTVFVYNAGGQLIAEYTTGTPTGGDTSYLTTDHLGSTRVVTDSGGNVEARYDYLPFGGEITVGVGGRSGPMGYGGPDSTRQKFTQKERDSESELDYFLARYYSSAQGRFTGPDEFTGGPEEFWFLGSGDSEKQALPYADIAEPQSLNKYQYCYDNPLRYVDGDGHGVRVKNPFTGLRGKGPAVPKAVQAGLAAVSGPIGLLSLVLDPPREGKTVGDYAEGFLTANAIGSLTGMAHPLLVPLPLPAGGAAVATGGASTALVAAETANAGSPNALVVRGGQNLPENFVNGSGVTKNSNGTLSGVSVNSAPGRTIAELSSGIKNGQIGVTTVGEIRGAGGSITPSATRNNPFHCTVCNLTPDRLSELFTPTIKNPSKP